MRGNAYKCASCASTPSLLPPPLSLCLPSLACGSESATISSFFSSLCLSWNHFFFPARLPGENMIGVCAERSSLYSYTLYRTLQWCACNYLFNTQTSAHVSRWQKKRWRGVKIWSWKELKNSERGSEKVNMMSSVTCLGVHSVCVCVWMYLNLPRDGVDRGERIVLVSHCKSPSQDQERMLRRALTCQLIRHKKMKIIQYITIYI